MFHFWIFPAMEAMEIDAEKHLQRKQSLYESLVIFETIALLHDFHFLRSATFFGC